MHISGIYNNDRRKLVTTEMKCLRRMLGVTRRDRLRNEDIRKIAGTTSVLDFIKKQQIRWFGHVSSLPTDSAPQRAMLLQYNGHNAKGRLRKRWTSEITEATKDTICEAHTRARFINLFLI